MDRRDDREHDLQRELRSHLDAEAAEQQERGLSAEEARYAARRAFGNPAVISEEVRDAWGWMWLQRFLQDVRFGLRTLRKDRGFSLLAICALALGIGAMTVIFSIVNSVLLEPFPYRDAQRLTKFYIHNPARPEQPGRSDFTMPEYRTFKEQNHVFEDVIGTGNIDVLYTDKDETKLFPGYETTANTFDFLGVQPLLGRPMVVDDGRPSAPPVAVMSYRAWRGEFNSDPAIIGKQLTLNDRSTTVIAVMPPRFQLYDGDFWLPLTTENAQTRVTAMGRIKPGITVAAASSELNAIAHNLAQLYPENYPPNFTVLGMRLIDRVVRRFRPLLYALLAAVTMLLLIACSNVANLLLARATVRAHEMAVRASLGASRTRLIVQLMVESFLLACAGCVAGCALAYAGIRGIAIAIPRDLFPNEAVIALNGRVLAFAVAMAFMTTLLSGLAPALHAVGRNLHDRIKGVGKGSVASTPHGRLRSALVVLQIALSLVLLVGAGLMMRSLLAIEHQELGFAPDHVLTARVTFPHGRQPTAEQKRAFFRAVLQRISALPGVVAATEASSVPPSGANRTDVTVPGNATPEKLRAAVQLCSDGYLKTLGARLLRGRWLTEAEIDSARRVIVVNQSLAEKFFGKEHAIGRSIKFNAFDQLSDTPHDAYFEIVGVIADVKNDGVNQPTQPEAFLPYTVTGVLGRALLLRTQVEPESVLPALRREVREIDPGAALTLATTLERRIAQDSYAQPRFAFLVMGCFAGIGLMLAAIGIFSVMAYAVSLQTHEIGVRMALGAQRSTVLKMVLRRGLSIIAIGVVVGELASLALTRLLQNQLWGVSTHDPLTLGGVVAVLLAAGTVACLVPARRATRVDPMVALRYE
jgi:predicted permease